MKTGSVKIAMLEAENFKRLTAIILQPTPDGLTVIGGRNEQGKTSVLDAIVFALGGMKHKPSKATKEGSKEPCNIKITLTNGIIVERKGKNSSLKVTDPNGMSGGQGVLDKFIEQLALNLPDFIGATSKQKAEKLLQIIGAGDELAKLDAEEKECYEARRIVSLDLERDLAALKSADRFDDTPDEEVSIVDLASQIDGARILQREFDKENDNIAECERLYGVIISDIEQSKLKIIAIREAAKQEVQSIESSIEKRHYYSRH